MTLDDLCAPTPAGCLLSNEHFTTFLTAAGGGYSALGPLALTRWLPDRTRDADGYFIYLRDLDDGVVWSAGYQPTGRTPDRYAVRHLPGAVEIEREDAGIGLRMDVAVAPEADLEIRRLTLTNRSGRTRRIELTSYAELVLNTPGGDAAHPAFSKLFVQTEHVPGQPTLLARRRLRSPDDLPLWAVHHLAGAGEAVEVETDRARFVGRGRTAAAPRALRHEEPLSGTAGNVLDPLFSLRCVVTLAPEQTAVRTFVLGAATERDAALALLPGLDPGAILQGAAAREAAIRKVLGLSAEEADLLQHLTGSLLYDSPEHRAPDDVLRTAQDPGPVLRRYGIGAAAPLLLLPLTEENDASALLRQGVGAQAYWRAHGLPTQLVVLTDKPPLPSFDAPGVHWLNTDDLPAEHLGALYGAARLVVRDGVLSRREHRVLPPPADPVYTPASASPDRSPDPSRPADGAGLPDEVLRLENGYGGFSQDGDEYVIRIRPVGDGYRLPPLPWTNVVANERAGFLATERGGGYTWAQNSREHNLTPWLNDPITDATGEALYLRDEDARVFWSPMPGPAPSGAAYEVRHGFGYTRYRHHSAGLDQDVLLFVPREDPVKITRVRLTNRSGHARRLSAFPFAQWVLGTVPAQRTRFVVTDYDPATHALLARNPASEDFGGAVAFAAPVGAPVAGYTADRTAFLGRHGSLARPAALTTEGPLDGRTGAGLDPCAAFQVTFDLAPGETATCAFLLGEGRDEAETQALLRRYADLGAIDAAFEAVRAFWQETTGAVQIETPAPALDLMGNGWLLYQNLSCRVWGRSAYYQSGGAFGFRDQLQDASALVYALPELTRAQILLHAAHQFVEGDVMHWWHPPASKGIRTRFSDDLLWLPYITAFYLDATGDAAILDESVRFLRAPLLEDGEDEVFLQPEASGEAASLFEHCGRALDRSLTRGAHGLPLMGTGDWNDGMNRVGREGRGESVWVGFFLYDILADFIPLCRTRGDEARAERYSEYREHLREALNDTGWDGGWYRRAYYDDGAPLGSAQNDECRIDALAQAWAVLSGAAPPDRAEQALDAMTEHLVSEDEGLIRLLTPAFDRTPHDPGYIKGYVPGVRENGGQYTHAAMWAVRALAEDGRREQAARLLEMLSPASHTRTPGEVAVYQTEPYVVAADVYGVAPHVGRGGWTWYTGSAGWMYRVLLESILGFRLDGGEAIVLRPCIPAAWPGFRLRYRLPGEDTVYEIDVENAGEAAGVTSVELDGEALDAERGARIPLVHDGRRHTVRVTLGTVPVPSD